MNGRRITSGLLALVLVLMLGLGLSSCSNDAALVKPRAVGTPAKLAGRISEVSPPEAIQELRQALEGYQPQVAIVSPRADQVIEDEQVSVRFRVQDFPLFKDQDLGLGPHLHVFLDNQPYIAVYDANEPLVLKDLAPGSHTIRAFASRPWHESFKNEGAYAQTTFYVFTKTPNNHPDPAQPLLTYSRPQGSYGAEPIMLDFYLTNAPLHLIAQESADDEIADWRIRCTVNGESFVFDRWQPIYLKGFKPGKNWVQLEFLDENGNAVDNAFNNTVRIVTYEPKGKDTLSKLMRGDLTAAEARGIVDRDYKPEAPTPEPIPEPAPEPTPTPKAVPAPEPSPTPAIDPRVEPVPVPEVPQVEAPQVKAPQVETPQTKAAEQERSEPAPVVPPPLAPTLEPTTPNTSQPKGFFNRFRRPSIERPAIEPTPVPPPTLPEVLDEPSLDAIEGELNDEQPMGTARSSTMGTARSSTIESPKVIESDPAAPSAEPLPSALEAPLMEPIFPNSLGTNDGEATDPETPAPQKPVVK